MNNIRKARIAKGLYLKEVAYELGISVPNLSQFENGKRKPNINILIKLSKILDVSVDYLLNKKEENTFSSVKTKINNLSEAQAKYLLNEILDLLINLKEKEK